MPVAVHWEAQARREGAQSLHTWRPAWQHCQAPKMGPWPGAHAARRRCNCCKRCHQSLRLRVQYSTARCLMLLLPAELRAESAQTPLARCLEANMAAAMASACASIYALNTEHQASIPVMGRANVVCILGGCPIPPRGGCPPLRPESLSPCSLLWLVGLRQVLRLLLAPRSPILSTARTCSLLH